MTVHLLSLEVELPLKRINKLLARGDRQLCDPGILPVKPAIGEEECIL